MKIRIAVTLDVDEDAWALAYGPNDGVRQDVKAYVLDVLWNVPSVRDVTTS